MKRSVLSSLFVRTYSRLPCKSRLLSWIVRLEGGDMLSLTLREILYKYHQVTVGSYSYGSLLVLGHADRHTEIGNYVSIGPNVRRFGAAHPLQDAALHPLFYNPALNLVDNAQDVERTSCSIGHDAWIGANVTILPGCRKIGVGAVVGAGSVLTKDVPDFTVVAGNPARPVRQRFSESHQAQILSTGFWSLEPAEALDKVSRLNERKKRL